jgi:hypothetical protein
MKKRGEEGEKASEEVHEEIGEEGGVFKKKRSARDGRNKRRWKGDRLECMCIHMKS